VYGSAGLRRLALVSLVVCVAASMPAPARAARSNLGLTAAEALAFARKALGAGDTPQAKRDFRAALDLTPVHGPAWASTLVAAARPFPELVDEFMDGRTGHPLPLAVLAEDEFEAAERPLMAVPEEFSSFAFLPPRLAREARFNLDQGDWKRAVQKLEALLDELPDNVRLLTLLGSIYERYGWTAAARERYESALEKAPLDEDRAQIEYCLIRQVVERKDYFEAERRIQSFVSASEKALDDYQATRGLKCSESVVRDRYMLLRRRIAAAYNLFGVVKMLKGQPREARALFDRALTETPGRPVMALNANMMLRAVVERDKAFDHLQALHRTFVALVGDVGNLARSAASLGGGVDVARLRAAEAVLSRAVADVAQRLGRLFMADRADTTATTWFEEAVARQPDDALPRYYLGRLQERRHDDAVAQQSYRQALARAVDRPELREACQARIEQLFEAEARDILRAKPRQEKLAEKAREMLDERELRELHADLEAGRILLQRAQFTEAHREFRRLSRLQPRCAEVHYYRGLAGLLAGRLDVAVDGFLEALAVDPEHPLARSHMAYLKMERGIDLGGALAASTKAFEARPDEPMIMVNHAWILFRLGERRQAYRLLKAATVKAPKEPLYHYRIGLMYFTDGLYDFALAKFREVLSELPDYPRALMLEGLCLARLGRVEEALASLSASVDGLAGSRDSRAVVIETVRNLKEALAAGSGGTVRVGRRSRMAAVTADEALRYAEARAMQEQAVAAAVAGQVERAKGLFGQAIEHHPRYANLSVDLGFLELLDGRLSAARTAFDRVLDYHGSEFRALSGYAHVTFRSGDLARFGEYVVRLRDVPPTLAYSQVLDAIATRWRQVLSINAADADAAYQLGRTQLLSGRCAEAIETFAKAQGPELDLLRGEAHLRLFVLNETESDYQHAKEALARARYPHLAELAAVHTTVTAPTPRNPEPDQPRLAELPADVWSAEVRESVRRGRPEYWQDWLCTERGLNRWKTVDGRLEAFHERQAAMRRREADIEEQVEREGRSLVTATQPLGRTAEPPATATSTPAGASPPTPPPAPNIDLDEVAVPRPDDAERWAALPSSVSPEHMLALARMLGPANVERCGAPPSVTDVPVAPVPVRETVDPSPRVLEVLAAAMVDVKKGLVDRAVTSLRAILDEAPDAERPLVALAAIELGSERWEAARSTIERAQRAVPRSVIVERLAVLVALRTEPSTAPTLSDRAVVTVRSTPEVEALTELWDGMLYDMPEDEDANVQRGSLAFVAGRWDEVQRCRRRVAGERGRRILGTMQQASAGAAF